MTPVARPFSLRLPSLLLLVVLLSLPLTIAAQETSEKAVSQPQSTVAPVKAAARSKRTSAAAKAKIDQCDAGDRDRSQLRR